MYIHIFSCYVYLNLSMPLGSDLAMTRRTMDVDKFHGKLIYVGLAQARPNYWRCKLHVCTIYKQMVS